MFSTPEEHPMPWLLSRKPELLFFIFPEVHVAGQSFAPDGLLRLSEKGKIRFVAVMVSESGRRIEERIPMPLLTLSSEQLAPENLHGLLARVRDLVETDRPREATGWAA
jgi:hypothetical protein